MKADVSKLVFPAALLAVAGFGATEPSPSVKIVTVLPQNADRTRAYIVKADDQKLETVFQADISDCPTARSECIINGPRYRWELSPTDKVMKIHPANGPTTKLKVAAQPLRNVYALSVTVTWTETATGAGGVARGDISCADRLLLSPPTADLEGYDALRAQETAVAEGSEENPGILIQADDGNAGTTDAKLVVKASGVSGLTRTLDFGPHFARIMTNGAALAGQTVSVPGDSNMDWEMKVTQATPWPPTDSVTAVLKIRSGTAEVGADKVTWVGLKVDRITIWDKNRTANKFKVPNQYRQEERIPWMVISGWCQPMDPAYLKIKCEFSPANAGDIILWKLLYDPAKISATCDHGNFSAGTEVETELHVRVQREEATVKDLDLVVGIDKNGNGLLEDDEIYPFPATLYYPISLWIVTKKQYEEALSYCDWMENGWLLGLIPGLPNYWFAAALMEQFIGQEETPDYSTGQTDVDNEFLLNSVSMPGLGINCLSDIQGTLPVFTFADGSYPSSTVKACPEFHAALKDLFDGKKAAVRQYFDAHPAEHSHTFNFSGTISKAFSSDDLCVAFGTAEIKFTSVDVDVVREGGALKAGIIHAVGKVWDIYDWDWRDHRKPATVQAGYEPACGRNKAGKIFGHNTHFNTTIDNLDYRF